MPSVTTSVIDASDVEYSFRFPVDLCRVILSPQIRLAASAVTNGISGPNITGQGPVDMVDRNSKLASFPCGSTVANVIFINTYHNVHKILH